MKKLTVLLVITAFLVTAIGAQDLTSRFDADKIRERVKRLSADDFEGRGPGTAGGKLAAQYIADQMRSAGVRPANGKSYFQNVKMVGVKADPSATLVVSSRAESRSFKFGDDFVATTG